MVDGSSVCVGLEHACVERNISHRNSGEQERGGGERLVSHVKQAQIALGRRGGGGRWGIDGWAQPHQLIHDPSRMWLLLPHPWVALA